MPGERTGKTACTHARVDSTNLGQGRDVRTCLTTTNSSAARGISMPTPLKISHNHRQPDFERFRLGRIRLLGMYRTTAPYKSDGALLTPSAKIEPSHLPADRDHNRPSGALSPSHSELILRRAQKVLRRIPQGYDARPNDVPRTERRRHFRLVHFCGPNVLSREDEVSKQDAITCISLLTDTRLKYIQIEDIACSTRSAVELRPRDSSLKTP